MVYIPSPTALQLKEKKDSMDEASESIAHKFVEEDMDLLTFNQVANFTISDISINILNVMQEYLETRIKYYMISDKLALAFSN
jgi:hypothetical protein